MLHHNAERAPDWAPFAVVFYLLLLGNLLPDYGLADAQDGAGDVQVAVFGEFRRHLDLDASLWVVYLGVVPAVFLLVVFEAGEDDHSVGRRGTQALVGVLDVEDFVAFGVFVALHPDDLAAIGAVGEFDDLGTETVVALLAGVGADDVVGFVVERVLRHQRAYAQQHQQKWYDSFHRFGIGFEKGAVCCRTAP